MTLLGKLEDSIWVEEMLLPALSDPDTWVRKNAGTLSLMKLGVKSSIPRLEELSHQEDDQVVKNVLLLAISQLKKAD